MEEKENRKKEAAVLFTRVGLSVALLLLGTLYLNEDNFPWYANLIVMLSSYLIIAYDVIFKAFRLTFAEKDPFNECTLMVLASFGAFALRAFGKDENEYMEGVLVILLYQIGEFFQDLAEDKSKDAITKAIDLRKEKAKVRLDGKLIEKDAEDILPGDVLLISSGSKVLCDGKVVSGQAMVDESSLTGEFVPSTKKEGDKVASGTMVEEGYIEVVASKAYSDSTVAKLLELVTSSAEKKSKATRFISRFSGYYTPIVMALAIMVAVLPPLFLGVSDGQVWARWIYAALSFLIVSCPCAVVISVPLAYFSGLGLASRSGVLVKGAAYFDQLNSLYAVAFDKTGTLTIGRFKLLSCHPKGISEAEFLEYAAASEAISNHPIAACLKSLSSFDQSQVSSAVDLAGEGVKAIYKGHEVFAGKAKEGDSPKQEGTAVSLYIDSEYRGYCLLGDEAKPNAKQTIAELNRRGILTCMFSGDRKDHAERMAHSLGLQEVKGGLAPEQKTEALRELIAKKKGTVAFVGDGINDAPSIALSDVGIAMGGLGSDAAVANADCVILNDDPKKIITLLRVAKKTKNRALFNILASLGVKGVVMALSIAASATGAFSMPIAVSVFADSGLALLMILSSLLLGFEKVK